MASHGLANTQLKNVSPDALVEIKGNELVKLWEDRLGLDIWYEIGKAAKEVADNPKISKKDKLEALIKVGELGLKVKRAGASDKSGAVQVNIMTPDLTPHLTARDSRG